MLGDLVATVLKEYGWLIVAAAAGAYGIYLHFFKGKPDPFPDKPWFPPRPEPVPVPLPPKPEPPPFVPVPEPPPKPPEPKPMPAPTPPEPDDERVAAFKMLMQLKDQAKSLIHDDAKRTAAVAGLEAYIVGMVSEK